MLTMLTSGQIEWPQRVTVVPVCPTHWHSVTSPYSLINVLAQSDIDPVLGSLAFRRFRSVSVYAESGQAQDITEYVKFMCRCGLRPTLRIYNHNVITSTRHSVSDIYL